MRATTTLVAAALLGTGSLFGCAPTATELPAPTLGGIAAGPVATDDGWSVAAPESAGLRPAALLELAEDIQAGDFPNTHAVLVEHDGALIYEQYFEGTDENWGTDLGHRTFGPEDLHDLRSISKSVTSALLGIALGSDYEAAVGRPVVEYLPYLEVDADKRAVTLHDVLTMTAGLQANEMTVPYTDPDNDEIRLYGVTDPALFVLDRPLVSEPGTSWYYFGGLSQVLASVVTEITGERLDDYARAQLFAPLGIDSFEWIDGADWTPDNPAAASGLRLRARDLAKFGSVYLRGGRWRGEQVVPEEWVRRSSMRHVADIGDWSNGGLWGYGYQWWVGELPTGERLVAGVGNGNQRLFVLPDEGLVVTVYAGQYNNFSPTSEAILERVLAARTAARP